MEKIKLEIVDGKSHWENVNIELLENMLNAHLIKEEDALRYLAHRNKYDEVIAWSYTKKELFDIGKKYGSERTRIQFKNYEIMKLLENKLVIKNTKISKPIKI